MTVELSVVLAAGVGTRLRPLTDRTNKCLLPVGGKPILRRALEQQVELGVREAVIVTGWRATEVRTTVTSWQLPLLLHFLENEAFDVTNNECSLHLAAAEAWGRPFLLHDGDIVMDGDVLAQLLRAPPGCALALRRADDLGDEEMKVSLDGAGRVTAIGKHIPPAHAAGEAPGVTRFDAAGSAQLFATIAERVHTRGLHGAWYEAAMAELIAAGVAFRGIDVGDAYLAEIDTPEDLERVDAEVRAQTRLRLVPRAASP